MTYLVQVCFESNIFGTFRQSVIFNFGSEPFLRKDLCVQVIPKDDHELEEDEEAKKTMFEEKLIHQTERWDENNCQLIDFDPPFLVYDPQDKALMDTYPHPQPHTFRLPPSVLEPTLTSANYR